MKRTSRKLCAASIGLGCALALGAPRSARAEIEIGVFGGGKFFNEQGGLGRRLAPGAPETVFNHGGIIGLRLGYLPIPRLAIEAETGVAMTKTRGAFNAMGELVEGSQQSVAVVPLRAHLLVNILTGRVRPFVLLGGGGHISTQLSPGIIQTDAVGALHAGAGLSVGIKENWGLRLDGRFILAQGPKAAADIMPPVTGPALVPEGELLLAIWGRFGGAPAPAPEAPPAAPPPPPPVDAAPPPPPPAVPPPPVVVDGDGDGVNDKDDQCPGQAGPGDNRGCPDTDKDGDGVVDRLDRCPDAAESKNGYQDEDGCPDELPKALKQFTGAIQGVGFEAGKDVITQGSFAVLDKAAQVLKDNPTVKLEIGGHTDSSGDATKNRELSQRRAEAVLRYLTDKGIAADRLKAVGYGPDKPVADNGTPDGRSKNRRVEFILLSGK